MKNGVLTILLMVSFLSMFSQTSKDEYSIIVTNDKRIVCKITEETSAWVYYISENNERKRIPQSEIERIESTNSNEIINQTKSDIKLQSIILKTFRDSVNYQLDYIRTCMYKHSSVYYTGLTMTLVGTSLSLVGGLSTNFTENPLFSMGLVFGGAALSTIGGVTMLVSHKWFKQASINPFTKRISYKIEF